MNDKNSVLTEVYNKAVVHHQKGNLKATKNLYKKILEQLPNHINTQSNIGINYKQLSETDKIDFKSGYESRRINITYLFGTRKIKKIN